MQQIINFILRNRSFLLFALLFGVSLFLTIQSHTYHKSKFINSANFLSGNIYKTTHGISQYFDLKIQNEILSEENKKLRQLLYSKDAADPDSVSLDSFTYTSPYRFSKASVIKNSFGLLNNYITLNKGQKDSVYQDYGVISSNGIVGIVDQTSAKFSRVMSILNSKSRINAQLKKTNHFGTLKWEGKSPELVQLVDIPKQAPVQKGDTIITGGRSTIFPKGIPIGSVVSFEMDETGNYFIVQVKLFNDMTNLGHVYIIKNLDTEEINTLETQNEQ
ncbi:MAG TPA: rod shape-determining protein MreC [Flavobacteriaceae bacterium]|nr:rod shape-determining protein MreC [Flavobacteriaceae bacterium]